MNNDVWQRGDQIVCVNNTISRNGRICGEPELKLHSGYTVRLVYITDDYYPNRVSLEEFDPCEDFIETRFMTIKEYNIWSRKVKILKIENPAD